MYFTKVKKLIDKEFDTREEHEKELIKCKDFINKIDELQSEQENIIGIDDEEVEDIRKCLDAIDQALVNLDNVYDEIEVECQEQMEYESSLRRRELIWVILNKGK